MASGRFFCIIKMRARTAPVATCTAPVATGTVDRGSGDESAISSTRSRYERSFGKSISASDANSIAEMSSPRAKVSWARSFKRSPEREPGLCIVREFVRIERLSGSHDVLR